MSLETVLIIIISTATAGHLIRDNPSDIHRPSHSVEVSECIAETKAAFDYENEPVEDLVEQISDCHYDIDGVQQD